MFTCMLLLPGGGGGGGAECIEVRWGSWTEWCLLYCDKELKDCLVYSAVEYFLLSV